MSEKDRDNGIHQAVFGRAEAAECPIRFLGHRHGLYHFVSHAGEKRALSARDLSLAGIISLFDGRLGWLAERFPPGPSGKGPFEHAMALAWLIEQCVEAGIWDDAAPLRSIGTWSTSTGEIVVHCGDAVWWREAWHPSGLKIDGTIYAAAPRIGRPDFDAMPTAAEVADILAPIARWSYRDRLGADRVLGWMGAAFLAAAPAWRDHAIIQGRHGCGKSTLTALVNAALGAASDRVQTDTSAAGLRQALTEEARAIMVDEAEGRGQGDGMVKILDILRHMSSGAGSSTRRGSSGGKAVEFRLVGAAWLAAILPPMLTPEDRSRFVVVDLAPLSAGTELLDVERTLARMSAASAGLWARMIMGWPRFRDSLALYRAELVRQGCSFRQADLVGTWAAGRDTLMRDDDADANAVDAAVDQVLPYVRDMIDVDKGDGEGERCLNHLLTSSVDAWAGGVRKTIGSLLQEAIHQDSHDARMALRQVGIRMTQELPPKETDKANAVRVFVVANKHAALDRIFAGTRRWEGGAWKTALEMIDGTFVTRNAVRFTGSSQARAIALPVTLIDKDFDAEEQHEGEGIPDIDVTSQV